MPRSSSLRRIVVVATAALTAAVACSAPAPAPPPAAPTPGPIPVYTLEKPEHRNPVPIAWDTDSGTFFVGTLHDGSIYQGTPDNATVPVFLEGQPGRSATGIGIAGERLIVAGGIYGDIRLYDLKTRARAGNFDTGQGGFLYGLHVTNAGDVWITDAVRPVLWHLTAEQVAAGDGTPTSVPLTPEIPHVAGPDNVEGVVALSETQLLVVKYADGALYRIDLDPQAPQGRTITPVAGATVPLGEQMILDGNRLVVPDENGVTVVELSEDAGRGTVVAQLRDPAFQDTSAVARIGDRYFVVNAAWNKPPPYTISSVPVPA